MLHLRKHPARSVLALAHNPDLSVMSELWSLVFLERFKMASGKNRFQALASID